jgi:hypothetical protein
MKRKVAFKMLCPILTAAWLLGLFILLFASHKSDAPNINKDTAFDSEKTVTSYLWTSSEVSNFPSFHTQSGTKIVEETREYLDFMPNAQRSQTALGMALIDDREK